MIVSGKVEGKVQERHFFKDVNMFKWSPANDKYLAFAKSTLSVFVSVLKTPSDCSPPFEIRLICQLTVFKNDNDLFCLSRFTRPIYTFCQLLIGNCHEK